MKLEHSSETIAASVSESFQPDREETQRSLTVLYVIFPVIKIKSHPS